jgi:hypothetical protein
MSTNFCRSELLGFWTLFIVWDPTERCLPLHLRMETDPVSETLYSLVFRIPDDGQSPKTIVITPLESELQDCMVYISEDSTFYSHCHENLKSHKYARCEVFTVLKIHAVALVP